MAVFLALLAVLVPASVTLTGYWFKQQSEDRLKQEQKQSEERLEQERKQEEERLEQERNQEEERLEQERNQEEERLEQERKQENDRLRLDAAIRAAELFARPSDDGVASAAKSASGLLALTRLDFVDLAVALLVDLWSPEASLEPSAGKKADYSVGVSTETAIQVINAALKGGGPDARITASELLCRHAPTLDICNSLHWPSSVNSEWIPELPVKAKLFIVDAVVHMALASENTKNALRELALHLYTISTGDPEPRVKGCVGMLMNAIIDPVEHLGYTDFMTGPGYTFIKIEQIKQVADEGTHHPDGYFELIVKDRGDKLAEWAKECSGTSFRPGMLASAS